MYDLHFQLFPSLSLVVIEDINCDMHSLLEFGGGLAQRTQIVIEIIVRALYVYIYI